MVKSGLGGVDIVILNWHDYISRTKMLFCFVLVIAQRGAVLLFCFAKQRANVHMDPSFNGRTRLL